MTEASSGTKTQLEPDRAGRGIRLLLVDDDPNNLLSLEATLDGVADDLVMARSGAEALRHLLDTDFAAILLDVKMPMMDGFETAQLIRNRKRSQHTPILFLTAYRNDEHLFRGYDLGAVDFLFKPIVPEILQSKVAVFVELARKAQLLSEQARTLAKAEQRFRSLLEAAPDAMLISKEDGQIVLVNSRTEQLFQWPRSELLGQNLTRLVPDWGHVGQIQEIELHGMRMDGSSFPAEMTFSPLQTQEGLLITTVVRDITDRKKAEQSIRRLNAELERRVAMRTAELMRSNEALRQFAWAASHDLQEPLRTVVTFTQLMQETCGPKLTADELTFMDYIASAGLRMNGLLAALRDFMRISETGQQDMDVVSASAVLDQALRNLETTIANTDAVVEAAPLPMVKTIPVALVQIFQNLIGNAIKYRSAEAPCIRIAARQSGLEWIFSVVDNGIGIDPQYHDRIFGVFKRLHGNDYSGTGIGLAICKTAVERLGGRIWVESELQKGSTFFFTIPVMESSNV